MNDALNTAKLSFITILTPWDSRQHSVESRGCMQHFNELVWLTQVILLFHCRYILREQKDGGPGSDGEAHFRWISSSWIWLKSTHTNTHICFIPLVSPVMVLLIQETENKACRREKVDLSTFPETKSWDGGRGEIEPMTFTCSTSYRNYSVRTAWSQFSMTDWRHVIFYPAWSCEREQRVNRI